MKTTCLFVLALLFCLQGNSQRPNSNISFVGNFSYTLDNEFKKGTVKLPKITSKRNGGTSGTLRLEVWLVQNKYYGSLRIEGFKLFTKQIGTLQGGWAYNDLKYDFDWEMKPPVGDYYVVFWLLEYDPRDGKDYALVDFLCFDNKFTVTKPIDYDAFWNKP